MWWWQPGNETQLWSESCSSFIEELLLVIGQRGQRCHSVSRVKDEKNVRNKMQKTNQIILLPLFPSNESDDLTKLYTKHTEKIFDIPALEQQSLESIQQKLNLSIDLKHVTDLFPNETLQFIVELGLLYEFIVLEIIDLVHSRDNFDSTKPIDEALVETVLFEDKSLRYLCYINHFSIPFPFLQKIDLQHCESVTLSLLQKYFIQQLCQLPPFTDNYLPPLPSSLVEKARVYQLEWINDPSKWTPLIKSFFKNKGMIPYESIAKYPSILLLRNYGMETSSQKHIYFAAQYLDIEEDKVGELELEEFFDPKDYPYLWTDFALTDGRGKVFEFRMEWNEGCADANSGAYGTVWYRNTGKEAFTISDYKADSENLITCKDEKLMQEFVVPLEEISKKELRKDSFLLNNYSHDHFLEKMIPIVMKITADTKKLKETMFLELIPSAFRKELLNVCLCRIFSTRTLLKQLPLELISLITAFTE